MFPIILHFNFAVDPAAFILDAIAPEYHRKRMFAASIHAAF